jgi:DNA-binding MarR family transcriptional regulator
MDQEPDRIAQGIAHWARARPDLDTSGTEVVGRILRLAAVCDEAITRALAPHGLGPGEYSVLAILRSHGGPDLEVAPKALTEATYLTTGGMANLVKRLETRGLVSRRPDPSDGRGVLVRLTAEGQRRVDLAVVDVSIAERTLVRDLSVKERRMLTRGLSRLLLSVDGRPTQFRARRGRGA